MAYFSETAPEQPCTRCTGSMYTPTSSLTLRSSSSKTKVPGKSSLITVTCVTAKSPSEASPFTTSCSATVKTSSGSISSSSKILIVMSCESSPGAKSMVPAASSKSSPALAVPSIEE